MVLNRRNVSRFNLTIQTVYFVGEQRGHGNNASGFLPPPWWWMVAVELTVRTGERAGVSSGTVNGSPRVNGIHN